MRILLISPPKRLLNQKLGRKAVAPIGIAYLAAKLREEGFDQVELLDCGIEGFETDFRYEDVAYYGLTLAQIEQRIRDFAPDIVGVSCLFANLTSIAFAVCDVAKACDVPHVVVGGPNPTAMLEAFTGHESIDFVFLGEGELSLLAFVRCVAEGKADQLRDLDGIAFRDENGTLCRRPAAELIADLDGLPLPARDLLPMERYFEVSAPQGDTWISRRNTPMITSRGCPAGCIFCNSARTKYRWRSAENVLEEMRHLVSEYGVEEVQIQDDNFTLNKQRALDICGKMTAEKLGLHWSLPQGVALWSLSNELIDAMADSGLHFMINAVESGSERVLKEVIDKPLRLANVPALIEHTSKRGIRQSAFFIIGFPDETLEEVQETFDFAMQLDLDTVSFSYASPLPGTKLWAQAKARNLFVDGFDLSNISYDHPNLKSENWTLDDLNKLARREISRLRWHHTKRRWRRRIFGGLASAAS